MHPPVQRREEDPDRALVDAMSASAYLSVLDDWDLVGSALRRIYDRVDEIVVVDGAYEWMAPLLTAMGRHPGASASRMRAALSPFSAKIRWIEGIWRDEMSKRVAGFEACSSRFVYRIDADEILFIDDAELDRFMRSDSGVAEMEMPIYLAPGLIRGRSPELGIERQALIFDRHRVTAQEHCSYLWLVMPQAERAQLPPPRPLLVYPKPVAFNAHLTGWRTPETAVSRARFYLLNDMRERRSFAWLPRLNQPDILIDQWLPRLQTQTAEGRSQADFIGAFFESVSPVAYMSLLLGHPITVGQTPLDGFRVSHSPLDAMEEATFAHHFAAAAHSLANLNANLASHDRWLLSGIDHLIDVSTPHARTSLGGDVVEFHFSERIESARVRIEWQSRTAPYHHVELVPATLTSNRLRAAVPVAPPPDAFRAWLGLRVLTASKKIMLTMRTNA